MTFIAPLLLALTLGLFGAHSGATQTITLHGHEEHLLLYGTRGAPAVIVSSGDGGWLHLAPHLAEWLAAHGYFVVGFDVKAYLSDCTDGTHRLGIDDIPADYGTLIDAVASGPRPPILVGVSEGAGLSVRAAADPRVRNRVAGVMTFGLGDVNELAWRWRDSIIYVTKGAAKEPTFSAATFVPHVSPVPLALLRATRDEFVTSEEGGRLAAVAGAPKRQWTIPASNHRFSDNLPGLDAAFGEALAWIHEVRDTHQSHP